jgi:pimeloyl-ACP methyl ester carboxylesterase
METNGTAGAPYRATLPGGAIIAYYDDWFGAPWTQPETVVLVHGIAEGGLAWTPWVPHLSGQLRVVRPDLPGFGSSPRPADHDCTPRRYASDLVNLIDALGLERVHLVAAKYGGTIALQFAGEHSDRLHSLCVVSSPLTRPSEGDGAAIEEGGVRGWAANSQRFRLGSAASEDQIEWWTELMGGADRETVLSCQRALAVSRVAEVLPSITAPTVIVTTTGSGLQTVAAARRWQETIPGSRLEVLDGDEYHVAATQPARCAAIVLGLAASSAQQASNGS